ncbi:hypothetical protein GOE20_26855 [Sinorhizobium medicae]|nr:hypothetical protein [Sinorhizobium medicae]
MEKFFLGLLRLFIIVGILFLSLVWSGIGLCLCLTPALYAAVWLARQGESGAAMGVFVLVLVATGLLSVYWKALSRVVGVFHLGNRVILGGTEKLLADLDNRIAGIDVD